MKNVFDSLVALTDRKVKENGAQYTAFGIFVICTYPLWHFFWIYFSAQPYTNLTARVIATFLCLFLALNKFWPQTLRKYLPLYWYLTLFYCLPFFFTFMLVKNNFGSVWFANNILALYFLMFLVDFKSFIFVFTLGTALGGGLGYLMTPADTGAPVDYFGIISTYLISFVIGGFFAHKINQTKIEATRSLGAVIAHELRTPLAAIGTGISAARHYFPTLVQGHKLAQENNLSVKPMSQKSYDLLLKMLDSFDSEVNYANTVVNMILMNSKRMVIGKDEFDKQDVAYCVEKAIERYPFKPGHEKLISFNKDNLFEFLGDEPLMMHVLFNLLKNALYFIQIEQKGAISIWCEKGPSDNSLYFRDTARGIAAQDLPKLFDRFHTTTRHGTGLGLAYCKMVMEAFGGEILCTSTLGEFTQFELRFPKIKP